MRKVLGAFIFLSIILVSCGGSDDGPPPPQPPVAASLVFPDEDSECTTGQQVTEAESSVTFRWDASQNTNNYELSVRSLRTGESISFPTTNTSFAVTLNKSEAYSWFVTSSSNELPSTAQSETWRFYNSGDGVESYAPFPANLTSPTSGQTLNAGNISLIWQGSDVDNDIEGYDVYFDDVNPPVTIVQNDTGQQSIALGSLTSGVYYWKIVSKDAEGNTSESSIFEFELE